MATDYILPTGQNQGSDPCVYHNVAPGLVPYSTFAPAGSFLRVDGSWAYPSESTGGVVAKSASFTVTTAQDGTLFNVTTGTNAIVVTLPTVTAANNGFGFYVRKADSGAGTIAYSPTQSSEISAAGHTHWVFTDGTSWFLRAWYGSFDSSGNIVITSIGNITLTGTTVAITGAHTISGLTTATGGLTSPSSILSTGAAGVGYATGAGGVVTQGTNRTTGVTLNKTTGQITLFTAAGSATAATFTVTNSTVAATDGIKVWQVSGTNLYNVLVTAVGTGTFNITQYTTGGTTSEAPVLGFAVIKGAIS